MGSTCLRNLKEPEDQDAARVGVDAREEQSRRR
jgi:hypothetical protein